MLSCLVKGLTEVQVPELKAKIPELRSMSEDGRIHAKDLPGVLSLAVGFVRRSFQDKKVGCQVDGSALLLPWYCSHHLISMRILGLKKRTIPDC